jgi:hypothetical protein
LLKVPQWRLLSTRFSREEQIVDFLSGLALVLLTLVGYSIGAVAGAKDRSPTPQLWDLGVVVVLWIIALFSRSTLGRWVAIGVWLLAGGLVSFVLSSARRNKMPSKAKNAAVPGQEGNFLERLWESWEGFATEMGNYQGRILFTYFYFLVVTPFGVLVRLFSDPLRTRFSTSPSFWDNRPAISNRLDEARRQF